MSGIDPARELAIRSIAHNLAYRFGATPCADPRAVDRFAHDVAELFDPVDYPDLAEAAILLWRAAGQQDTTHITMAGLAPEENPPDD